MIRPVLLLITLVLSPAAFSQPLASLVPAESVLTLGWTPTDVPGPGDLERDLAALDWARAGRTLEALGALAEDDLLRDLALAYGNLFRGGQGLMSAETLKAFEACPEQREFERRYTQPQQPEDTSPVQTALLAVSVSPYNPIPAATALLRATGEGGRFYADVQRVLIRCSERQGVETRRLREGNVTLTVVGDGGDLPVILGRVGDLFIAGTNPEVVRGVVRRAGGSDEPSFAATPLYARTAELLDGNGMTLSVGAAALADAVEGLGGALVPEPEARPALTRLTAALRTLGGYAGALRVTQDGLLLESLLAVNPQGGDPALADLLLCDCPVTRPALAPSGSVGVTTRALQLRAFVDYLQGLLDDVAPLTGERLDLRALLRQEADFDLDRGLLDWVGSEVTVAGLEPFGPDLRTLLGGQAQVWILPVRSREAADAGRAELLRALRAVLSGLEASGEDDLPTGALQQGSVERTTYEGVPVTRYRFGFSGDLGTAYVGNALVIGSPAASVERVIDVFTGQVPSILEDAAYRAAQTGVPERVTGRSFTDRQAQLSGIAELLRLTAQPLAFAAAVGLGEAEGNAPSYADLLHLTEMLPNALSVLAEHVGPSSSYSQVQGSSLYRRAFTEIAW